MGGAVRLVFGVHCHQPVGNFDEVLARALANAYDPFLDALERHPSIRAVLHYSGCLCEWLERRAPAHLDRLAEVARSGQVEILTGGFYEPILPLIPPADRVGQIRMQTRYIRERFGVEAGGMWLPERVWEPTLPGTLREAGVDYTLLDDYHFLTAVDGDPVGGYYLTEDHGEITLLFPISERLRYMIPFREPHETIAWLGELAASTGASDPAPVAVIVDDGEKFGLWPGTREWVHGSERGPGWLESFLRALEENASWIRTSTLRQVVEETPPRGRVYIPPGSYFEMGGWALPAARGRQFDEAVREAKRRGAWEIERPFLRGGFFRNFQAKYPESLLMARRAQLISALLEDAGHEGQAASDRAGSPSRARRELWRAMCNCAYWHGIFGGLYLPHIRRAVGEHLCRARRLAGGDESRATALFMDADADGRRDVEIHTARLGLLVQPAHGGAIAVFDIKDRDYPLGGTLTRRFEAYHEEILRPHHRETLAPEHSSIHERAARASGEARALIVADDRTRASAVDRFLEAGAGVADLARGLSVERGDFYNGTYTATLAPPGQPAGVVLARDGAAAGRPVRIIKTIRTSAEGRRLEVLYRLGSGPPPGRAANRLGLPGVLFAVEFNLALVESMGRIVLGCGSAEGTALSLSEAAEAGPVPSLRVEERYAGFTLTFRIDPQARVWHYPVRTVSRSETAYETIYQGSALLLVWGGDGTVPREARLEIEVGLLERAQDRAVS